MKNTTDNFTDTGNVSDDARMTLVTQSLNTMLAIDTLAKTTIKLASEQAIADGNKNATEETITSAVNKVKNELSSFVKVLPNQSLIAVAVLLLAKDHADLINKLALRG